MAETYNDINLKSLVFNKVTNEEYRQMVQNGTIKDDEFYITPSELIDVPNIDSTTSGKYLTNDGTGALWSDVQSTNVVQDLSNPSADTVLSSQGVANESSRIISIMDTGLAKKLNVDTTTVGEITDLRTPKLNEGNTSTLYIDGYMINSADDINGCLVAPVLYKDGIIGNRLMARKKINGHNVYQGLTIGVKADGSLFTNLGRGKYDNSIVTTASHGSNYVRFGNGIQICWGYAGSGEQLITFPQPFKDANYSITATGGNIKNEAYPSLVRDESKTSTSVKIYCQYLAKNYIVIGYWY